MVHMLYGPHKAEAVWEIQVVLYPDAEDGLLIFNSLLLTSQCLMRHTNLIGWAASLE